MVSELRAVPNIFLRRGGHRPSSDPTVCDVGIGTYNTSLLGPALGLCTRPCYAYVYAAPTPTLSLPLPHSLPPPGPSVPRGPAITPPHTPLSRPSPDSTRVGWGGDQAPCTTKAGALG
eukprot:scaffold19245_cov118-Isochrysis_galbana.AAC.4